MSKPEQLRLHEVGIY